MYRVRVSRETPDGVTLVTTGAVAHTGRRGYVVGPVVPVAAALGEPALGALDSPTRERELV